MKHNLLLFGKILSILLTLLGTAALADSSRAESVTFLVKDINPNDASNPTHLLDVDGILFFVATDSTYGTELWQSDGTLQGTIRVKDIYAGANSSTPSNLIRVKNILFFAANDAGHGTELWKSDGTEAGTNLVKDINAQGIGDDSNPTNLVNVNDTLFFTADDGEKGRELWRSNGTPTGTIRVKDINPSSSSSPANLVDVDNTLFFTADDGQNGRELWRSDGTPTGTTQVKDINPSGSSSPTNLVDVNGTLFFTADDGEKGRELWKSDGTSAGTMRVKDINPFGSSGLGNLVDVNGTLFFTANGGTYGYELWLSDGSEAGTKLVKDIRSGSSSSGPAYLTNVNGVLFFQANDGENGRELWKSDGTESGTILVKDINDGSDSSAPMHLINGEGNLLFTADDSEKGRELWKSDGTIAGTVRVSDIYDGESSSMAANITVVQSLIFLTAKDEDHGTELWAVATPAISLAGKSDVETATVGQTVHYTYTVTNTGNINLSDLILYDDKLGQIDLDQTALSTGQNTTVVKTYQITEYDLPGPLINTAIVTGTIASNLEIAASTTKVVTLNTLSSDRFAVYLPMLHKSGESPSPDPDPTPNSTTKKGIAAVTSPSCVDLKTLNAHWYMNWTHLPDPTCDTIDADKFVPRIYDAKGLPFLSDIIDKARPSGWLIGFNEPNLPWHANLSPSEGAEAWKQIEEAADAAGIKLVSPAPNQWEPNRDGLPHGHQWTWAMVDEYETKYGQKPRFDAMAWHIYNKNPQAAKGYLTARHNEMLARGYDVPVWVLEYGGECWDSQGDTGNQAMMTDLTAWFEATPWIGRYAWFANRLDASTPGAENYQSCTLIDPQKDEVTTLGQWYSQF